MATTPNSHAEISPGRKTTYYFGLLLSICGFLMFTCPFFTMARAACSVDSGPTIQLEGFPRPITLQGEKSILESSIPQSFGFAVIGFFLMVAGGWLMSIGKVGLAGAGLILDPQQARNDIKPWSRAAGGVVSDVIQGIDQQASSQETIESPAKIMVRCRGCKSLNPELSKYCGNCGQPL